MLYNRREKMWGFFIIFTTTEAVTGKSVSWKFSKELFRIEIQGR